MSDHALLGWLAGTSWWYWDFGPGAGHHRDPDGLETATCAALDYLSIEAELSQ